MNGINQNPGFAGRCKNAAKHHITVFKKNWQLLLLCIPALTGYIVFNYVPMFGQVMAFKNYKYKDGIWGSEWVGFRNFKYLLGSPDFGRLVRNTVLYSLWLMIIGMVVNIAVALLMYEIDSKKALKVFQGCYQIPRFMSWTIIGFISYAILDPSYGILNTVLTFFGAERVNVFTILGCWPLILTLFSVWRGLGSGSLLYYSTLMGIDQSLFEAARIDGASRWKQIWHISLPGIVPVATVLCILGLGDIFDGDFGLFYQIPRDTGNLYPVTDIISTYVFRALMDANFSAGSAVSFFESVLGLIMVLLANAIVKKISPENSLF